MNHYPEVQDACPLMGGIWVAPGFEFAILLIASVLSSVFICCLLLREMAEWSSPTVIHKFNMPCPWLSLLGAQKSSSCPLVLLRGYELILTTAGFCIQRCFEMLSSRYALFGICFFLELTAFKSWLFSDQLCLVFFFSGLCRCSIKYPCLSDPTSEYWLERVPGEQRRHLCGRSEIHSGRVSKDLKSDLLLLQ